MIDDYFVAVIPEDVDIDDVASYDKLMEVMKQEAYNAVISQYRTPPKVIVFEHIEWLVTDMAEAVERFQPDHDCDECREGNRRASQFLVNNPGRSVVCANLHYTEVWT